MESKNVKGNEKHSTAVPIPPLNSTARLTNCITPNSKNSFLTSTYHETPENAIRNPFDGNAADYINKMKNPILSPSVFENILESDEEGGDSEPFWGIEHIALINPADIDDSAVLNQQSGLKLSEAEETAAQNSITRFFASCNLPSPSPSKCQQNLVAIFSPSVKAANFRKKNLDKMVKTPVRIENIKVIPIPQLGTVKKSANYKSNSTQTDLSFPVNVDVEKIFSEYIANVSTTSTVENMSVGGTSSANTSLRRRLFTVDGGDDSSQSSLESEMVSTPTAHNVTTPSKYDESPISLKNSDSVKHNLSSPTFCQAGTRGNMSSPPMGGSPSHPPPIKLKFDMSPGFSPIAKLK